MNESHPRESANAARHELWRKQSEYEQEMRKCPCWESERELLEAEELSRLAEEEYFYRAFAPNFRQFPKHAQTQSSHCETYGCDGRGMSDQTRRLPGPTYDGDP